MKKKIDYFKDAVVLKNGNKKFLVCDKATNGVDTIAIEIISPSKGKFSFCIPLKGDFFAGGIILTKESFDLLLYTMMEFKKNKQDAKIP